jgi:hypothetical protein
MKPRGIYGQLLIVILSLIFSVSVAAGADPKSSALTYDETVAQWKSYQDVARWFKDNFTYDSFKLMHKGRDLQNPADTFKSKKGVCFDAANLVIDALNRINPAYDARSVFVKNALGQPQHWVAAFTDQGKLYIMDYAAGNKWFPMNGVHGPYESLKDYEKFMSSLKVDGFVLDRAVFRDYK